MIDPGSHISVSEAHEELVAAMRKLAHERSDLVVRHAFNGLDGPEATYTLSYEGAKWLAQKLAP